MCEYNIEMYDLSKNVPIMNYDKCQLSNCILRVTWMFAFVCQSYLQRNSESLIHYKLMNLCNSQYKSIDDWKRYTLHGHRLSK